MTNQELNGKLLELVRRERALTHEILELINIVETRGRHFEMGYSSLFDYLTRFLGYCESSSYRRMQAARLLREVPAAKAALVEGKLQLTQMAKVESAAKGEAQNVKERVLEKLEGKNLAETKKILALEFSYEEKPKAQVTYCRDEHVNLTLRLSSEQFAKLKQVQALLSHAAPGGSFEEILEKLCDEKIKAKTEIKNPPKILEKTGRTHINTNLRKQIFHNANYECQFPGCRSKHFLELEHIQPLAHGGSNEPANLTVLCRAHNQLRAKQAGFF